MKEAKLQEKQAAVADVVDKMKRAQCMVVLDYRGLTVEEVTSLRNQFREVGVEYKVIKNNMLKRAADELNIEGVDEYFKGPSAVAFGYEDPVAPAKVLCKFVKGVNKTEIKGGILDGKVMDAAGINSLSKLPSKEELIAKMLGSLNAPVTNFALALQAIPRGLACALNAVVGQKQQ
ncbi:MAG: 50S ribosomal protein L10 [Christensenella sp.]|uniref:50S ribosomal protein L10 n=1 Tax=Christensenella sp. TaxID=1935934 RepID=UPI002B1EC7E1|nr:50S ribosomal protein L10 [Christensenella sp.]MEA5002194.1 50S ribosomal protein L10 [Christensenella sp.]